MRTLIHIALVLLLVAGQGVAAAQSIDGGRGAVQDEYMGLSAWADDYGLIMVAPDGTPSPAENNPLYWDATTACCNWTGAELDDSGYLSLLSGRA